MEWKMDKLVSGIREKEERGLFRGDDFSPSTENGEMFRLLIESIKDYAIYVLDPEGRIVSWSAGARSIKGYREEEILGKHFSIFYPSEDAACGKPDLELRTAEREGCLDDEGWRVRKGGEKFWANVTVTALTDQSGKLRGFAKVTRDISERKRAEDALRRGEERLAAILNSIADSILMINEDRELVWANHAACRLFGRDVLGKACHSVFDRCGRLCELCPIPKCFRDGKGHEHEIEIIGLDGQRRQLWCTVNLAERHENGMPKRVVLVGHDITDKKVLQAEAMRAGHLASLGELAAGVAHEINNPANSIINYAQLLIDLAEEKGEHSEIPSKIVKEGERIASIVKTLLSFARDRRQGRAPDYIQEILGDALNLARAQIQKDGITLRFHVPDDLPAIMVHSQQIQQVFLNLLSNARYALNNRNRESEDEKLLEIVAEVVDLDGSRYLRLVFHDRGMGIPHSILDRLCDPFFTTKPAGEGTGLGLSVSHGIIRNHGGRLCFESVEGEYTRVIVDLPLNGTDGE